MRPGRIVALVVGSLLMLPALGILVGGGALGITYLVGRDGDGYFDVTLDRLDSPGAAVTSETVDFAAEPGTPDWVLDALDTDIRLRATAAASDQEVFVGVAREADVDAYLAGVDHDEIIELIDGVTPVYRSRTGSSTVANPTVQDFWQASAAGPGTQELTWEATSGRWVAVVMNADGSPGIATDLNIGAKAGFVAPTIWLLLGVGAVLAAGAAALIAVGATGTDQRPDGDAAPVVVPIPVSAAVAEGALMSPVTASASLDPGLSRWQWLMKWFLAIPHFIVLVFLWIGFVVLTVIAGVAILFTGRYPAAMFEFNVGVMRWSWRVNFYATTGGIGTDQYPPFSLQPDPSYPAELDVAYPERLNRWLVLVKWFLAIPHLVIVALLAGTSVRWLAVNGDRVAFDPTGGGGLLGLLVLAAGVVLLFTGRYPPALFDLIVGLNRWIYRVVAYVALMTDTYPPFRLDQGGPDQAHPPTPPPVAPTAERSLSDDLEEVPAP